LFDAYSFVLRRANEYAADHASAKLVGVNISAEALVRSSVMDAYLESRFWPSVYQTVEQQPEPPQSVYTQMKESLRTEVEPDIARQWLDRFLTQPTDSTDSHPSLSDRLRALGQTAELPAPLTESAADHFLHGSLETVLSEMNTAWQEDRLSAWHERHDQIQSEQHRLQELDRKSVQETLPASDILNGRWNWMKKPYCPVVNRFTTT
jgi:hypothetical protein